MEEFKNDLIELFKKHNMLVLCGSVQIDFSPLIYDGCVYYTNVTMRFSKVIEDRKEQDERWMNYGLEIKEL